MPFKAHRPSAHSRPKVRSYAVGLATFLRIGLLYDFMSGFMFGSL